MNDFGRQWEDVREDATAAFLHTAESGWYVLGGEVREFESRLAGFWGLTHAVGVASGLDAIEISLRALGCGVGSKVLTTPVSAFATTLAILKLGAIPVFADVDDNGLLDLSAAEEALRTDSGIRFFVPVHLFGHALDMDTLRRLQREFGVAMVEDCAQSVGAHWKQQATGTVGMMAATSFYPTKNLGAMGDGGAILTNDTALARRAAILRDYGQSAKYHHGSIGYNSRLDEIQASLLRCAGLPRIARWTERRRTIAQRYISEICHRHVAVARSPSQAGSSWHLFPVTVAAGQKAAFVNEMNRQSIATGEHYPQTIPDQPVMRTCRFEIAAAGIEKARTFCRTEVTVPIHPYLNDDEVSTIIDCINRWHP